MRLPWQRRMAAQQDHGQLIVQRDCLHGATFREETRDFVRPGGQRRFPPKHVQRPVPGHREQPRRRIGRHAAQGPLLQRFKQRVLHHVLS
jgi:hypothetical protein